MQSSILRQALALLLVVFFLSPQANACDVCALYTAVQVESPIENALRLGIAEQFTSFDRLQRDGHFVSNTENQFLKSSVTQLSAQYDPSTTTSLQLVLPVVSRTWRRIQEGSPQRGSNAGIGDITLLAHYVPMNYAEGNTLARLRVFAGVELPTGDAHYLGEETAPDHHEESQQALTQKHGGVVQGPSAENAIHGHDITLGSGSWDFPLGAGLFTQWDKFIFATDVQYTIRTEGSFSYKYANDLIWSTAVGRYLYLEDNAQIALRARLSGQYKDMDTGKGGVEYTDTAYNTTFLGPEISTLVAQQWQGVFGLDLPINVKNSDLQITPSYRIRAALSYRF